MQGLINRGIQCFVRDNYGWSVWLKVVERAGVDITDFEAFLDYEADTTDRIIDALTIDVERPKDELLEDFGTYLVVSNATQTVRRLLRFSGSTFEDFVQSLDELPQRVNMAMSELTLPDMTLHFEEVRKYRLEIAEGFHGFSHVVLGVLRAMADDYGALAFLEREAGSDRSVIRITLADEGFAVGRSFDLTPVAYAAG